VLWAVADEVYGRCGDFRAALRGLGTAGHGGPAGVPAGPPPAGPREELVNVLPLPRGGRQARDPDLFHHHSGKPLAIGNYFPDHASASPSISADQHGDDAIKSAPAGAIAQPGSPRESPDRKEVITGNRNPSVKRHDELQRGHEPRNSNCKICANY
jgi:hypothetical protein